MKFKEKEIQEHIWENRHRFAELLEGPESWGEIEFDGELWDLTAQALVGNRIAEKLKSVFVKLNYMDLIGCEVPLRQESNSTIRADFLSTFPGNTGIGVVELKRSKQTEREAFTELLAYSNHLTTVFPGMSREDIVYILISPMETRIARDAVIQSLTFDNRNVIALVPSLSDPDDLKTLTLTVWLPKESELCKFSEVAFRGDHFNVCKIVWECCEGWWNPPDGENPSSSLIAQFNNVSAIAAQKMEESGIHGFTYCSQMWSELQPKFPFPNSLVLVGLNPYGVGSSQHIAMADGVSASELPPPAGYTANITEIIPGLKKSAAEIHEQSDYLDDLYRVWDSQLYRIGKDVVDAATQNTTGTSLNTDSGFMDWDDYQVQFLEHISCHNFAIRPTGLLRNLYMDVTKLDYALCGKVGVENHPIHGDMHHHAIEALTSSYFFDVFLRRMFGDNEL